MRDSEFEPTLALFLDAHSAKSAAAIIGSPGPFVTSSSTHDVMTHCVTCLPTSISHALIG
jgi:hypothetical protein